MRLQRKWTSNITIRTQPNNVDVTLLPGNVVDVTDKQYQALKDLYGTQFMDVGNDATLQVVEKSLTTAEVKALYSAPQQLVVAPGAGYGILVEKAVVSVDYNSAAYATNTDLYITYDLTTAGDGGGASTLAEKMDSILKVTADSISYCNAAAVDERPLVLNKGITAIVATGNPATGNSPVKIKVFYRIISI